jgi:enediyne biosynthesis protein E4
MTNISNDEYLEWPIPFVIRHSRYSSLIPAFLLISALLSCEQKNFDSATRAERSLFTLLPPEKTHVTFSNTLTEGLNTNILMYEYFYNGGGVASSDLNGDGLMDIYFSSNMAKNRLYLNHGNFLFEDITDASGAMGRPGPWKTGVTIVDVNGDNLPDIYVCYSGMVKDENRANQLFIHQGNDSNGIPHFKDLAKEYGLDSRAYSNQAYFFDYDRDGDLDMLLLNHNPKSLPVLNEVSTAKFLQQDSPLMGVRLYRQSENRFDDVTAISGISSSALTYGLGIGISDFSGDGWPDFYVSNDYAVPDYLYINNGNGTFTDKLKECMGHISHFSMGNDVADVNNDGLPDIITLDMLPPDNHRQKLLLAPDNYGKFDLNIRSGFHYQYMRNMLHINNGNGTFSEIGQLAGISNTDWSWAALLADYDNDGWKDLFVTNGYLRDYTNLDFIKYMDDYVKVKGRLKREDVVEIIRHMPATNVANFIFRNTGSSVFTDQSKAWGIDRPSNSNGATYTDLDNDGDLDLVVNNINQPAYISENTSVKDQDHHFIQIKLKGSHRNTQGIGAKVIIAHGTHKQYLEQFPSRGYLSAVSPILHFGLGKAQVVDTLTVSWPDGKQQTLFKVQADQQLLLEESNATKTKSLIVKKRNLFEEVDNPIPYKIVKSGLNDFKRQPLLMNQLSYFGPCLAKGDVNHDALEDVYAGNGAGQPGVLFIQQPDRTFSLKPLPAFEDDKNFADADATFLYANGDGHIDLYVASGGYHQLDEGDPLLQDRLYLNDGKGNFTKANLSLPVMRTGKGCVTVTDMNSDHHPDLFVGGWVVPGRYPECSKSYLLINDGHGNFADEIETRAPELQNPGMITDALWADINHDDQKELIVTGEWMPVSIFVQKKGRWQNETSHYFNETYSGFWNTLAMADFNHDNQPDILAGNAGNNQQFRISHDEPADLYFTDFDQNGSVDPLLCFYIQGKSYPYVTRDELLEQLGSFRSRFNTYQSYSDVSLSDIFKKDELNRFRRLTVNHQETTLFLSGPDGKYKPAPLPAQVQYAPVNTITVLDYNHDSNPDVILCGNNHHTKLRLGKSDANYGVLLKGNGRGGFQYINQSLSGFRLRGEVRSVVQLETGLLLIGVNEQGVVAYQATHRLP